ncbi:hypothetical protein IMCC13023_06570 [Candidatus Aquiluna sp. IMCC13023]|nr:hypothetical protein IMCC13023_06570 [Candidatus Aquiluna sp. IMCC13023]
MVRAPGQKAAASLLATRGKSVAKAERVSTFGISTGGGTLRSLPLVLRRSSTALWLKASTAMP